MTDDGCAKSVFLCKARDLFAAAENVLPIVFDGCRVHMLFKSREPWVLTPPVTYGDHSAQPPPPPPPSRYTAASMLKLTARPGTGATLHAAGTLGVRLPYGGMAFGTAEVNPLSGHWSFEAVGKSAQDAVDVSVAGQVAAWCRPLVCSLYMDYTCPSRVLSVHADPVQKKCAFQVLQAVTSRLSLGAEINLPLQKGASTCPGAGLMARYAGPDYLVCGKVNPLAGFGKLAWYRHNSDRLQTSVTFEMNAPRSTAVTRMAFRVLTDRSTVHAAVDTNGVVSSQIERKLLAVSVSASLSMQICHKTGRYGLGFGLSF